jgi:hypothetical protein
MRLETYLSRSHCVGIGVSWVEDTEGDGATEVPPRYFIEVHFAFIMANHKQGSSSGLK